VNPTEERVLILRAEKEKQVPAKRLGIQMLKRLQGIKFAVMPDAAVGSHDQPEAKAEP
jgi:hypothetical protein